MGGREGIQGRLDADAGGRGGGSVRSGPEANAPTRVTAKRPGSQTYSLYGGHRATIDLGSINKAGTVKPGSWRPPLPPQSTWSAYASAINLDTSRMSRKDTDRQEVIYELIRTEDAFCRDIDLVIEVFLRPLWDELDILTPEEVCRLWVGGVAWLFAAVPWFLNCPT